jgi:hypothetical protein
MSARRLVGQFEVITKLAVWVITEALDEIAHHQRGCELCLELTTCVLDDRPTR